MIAFAAMKGIIALDIDGTITVEHNDMPSNVKQYLTKLAREGWHLIFITGRTFQWAYEVLHKLDCPYHVAVQNGAIILEMPSRKIIAKKYLDASVFPLMEAICLDEPTDFVVYGGYEHHDHCWYRPDHFKPTLLEYVSFRKQVLKEMWFPLQSFNDLPISAFPSIKCFGFHESADRVARRIETELGLHVPLIRDPFQRDYYVVQATHPDVSKGQAVEDFKAICGEALRVIAAGDDNNDRSMLAAADVKVVMATAPREMFDLADIIAPSAQQEGIIQGLDQAMSWKVRA